MEAHEIKAHIKNKSVKICTLYPILTVIQFLKPNDTRRNKRKICQNSKLSEDNGHPKQRSA